MECNRDEATRAKEIAERKFSSKDIMGAKKFALKAQTLFPGLEGISQFLAILDVYVAVENKINGELDLYGILGVSPLADDDTVRKHYRKLALSLHPDKNKSVGADGAFKYVSEAWSLLSDKDKRSAYDRKRNSEVFRQKMKTPNGGSRAAKPPGQNGYHGFTKSTTNRTKGTSDAPTKTGPASSNKQTTPVTFWTLCKKCMMQYEFVRMYVNRKLLCPGCHEPFLAVETSPPVAPPNTNGSSEVPKKAEPGHGGSGSGSGSGSASFTTFRWVPFPKKKSPAATAQAATMVQRAYEKVKREREEAQAAVKREEALRRKTTKKTSTFSPPGHSNPIKSETIDDPNIKNQLIKKATTEIKNKLNEWSSNTTKNPTNKLETDVPDAEFHDFDQERSETCFEEDQVWAAYDHHDGMPRIYAMIRKVISLDPFKIKVCWLNPKPEPGLGPISKAVGEFKMGKPETLSVPNYFSHKVDFTKRVNGTVHVFPKEGDVWALYKDDHKYEVVEVEDYDEETGITVVPLVKVSGFKTVFCRGEEKQVVLKKETVRFSHQIPSNILTGKESASAPKGSCELDPASVPPQFLKDRDCVLADFKEDGSKW